MASSLAGLKILKVVPSVFSPKNMSSGMKSYTYSLGRYLRKDKAGFHVLAASIDGGAIKDATLVEIPRKSDVMFSFYVIPPFIRLKGDYDIIHASDPFLTLPLLLALARKPSVITLHEVWSDAVSFKRGFVSGLIASVVEYLSLRLIDSAIAVDERVLKAYLSKYAWLKGKIRVVGIGVDSELFKPLGSQVREEFGLKRDDRIVLYVGRYEKEKNIPLLLDAFALVEKKRADARLVLYGSGKDKKKLKAYARKIGVEHVDFRDAVMQGEVPRILNCADVFALTSEYESCPLVVQEALACGVPVVSVDVGRCRELVNVSGGGQIVSRDAGEMAEALLSYLDRRDELKVSCRKCVEDYTFDKTVAETERVYEGILS